MSYEGAQAIKHCLHQDKKITMSNITRFSMQEQPADAATEELEKATADLTVHDIIRPVDSGVRSAAYVLPFTFFRMILSTFLLETHLKMAESTRWASCICLGWNSLSPVLGTVW